MKHKKALIISVLLLIVCIGGIAFAHQGRTDANGGHRDNKNQSGLGGYHYHCGGYPAHLHTNGVCPYKSTTTSSSSNTSPTVSTGYVETNTKKYDDGYEDGYDEGHSEGYNEGYDEGLSSGYDKGYDEGHSDGYDEGYDEGHRVGYDKGLDDGYKNRVEEATAEREKELTFFLLVILAIIIVALLVRFIKKHRK